MTKQQHRRDLLLSAAALLAVPVALRPSTLFARLAPSRPSSAQKLPSSAETVSHVRPRIMTPTGSVKRRA